MASASAASISGSRTMTSAAIRGRYSPLPVVAHEFARPRGLADLATGAELGHVRLDVEHRRAVDGVEATDQQPKPVDGDELAHRDADAVRAGLAPLGQDPDCRPVVIASRMAGA